MRKILLITLIFTILLSFASCDDIAYEVSQEDQTKQAIGNEDGPSAQESSSSESEYPEYKVTRVVDGDTLVLEMDGSDEKIRLIGVDTPESVHPDKSRNTKFGKTVSNFSKAYLEGKYVGVELDVEERDQYGRMLAYIYVDNTMYNKVLLEKGYAMVSTYPPNVKYTDTFTEVQKQARESGEGMWNSDFQNEAEDSKKNTASGDQNSFRGHSGSKKFHAIGCRYGDMISDDNLREFNSKSNALDEGYSPCKVCNP